MSADVDVPGALEALEAGSPLVEALTNTVTVSEVANVVLHWGGLPVMSEDRQDAVEMSQGASACLFNVGTADEADLERMRAVGEAAGDEVPIVLDPVGVGATPRRSEIAERLLADVELAVVKGNYGEVSALAGDDATVRGVESVGGYAEIAETAIACARETGAVVVATGEVDVVADEQAAYELAVGHEQMGSFVGTGCMLGGTGAAFAGALAGEPAGDAADRPSDGDGVLAAAIAGTAAFGIAGERAAAGECNGPASYRTAFMDAVAGLTATDLAEADVATRIDLAAEA